MSHLFEEVSVTLTNEKVQFRGESPNNPGRPIAFDYYPPLGDGDGFNGLELLLMSLAGCFSTAVVYTLRKMGKGVAGLNVHARGERTQQIPVKFSKIHIEVAITSSDVTSADATQAMQLAEESFCPVWQMVKGNVEMEKTFTVSAE